MNVSNRSGEAYENAEVSLIIGNVNLVQTVQELARGGEWGEASKLYGKDKETRDGARFGAGSGGRPTQSGARVKKVEKESIGEYAIFTIEGRETVEIGWTKRLSMAKPAEITCTDLYSRNPQEFGTSELIRVVEFKNDKESGLGEYPMPAGSVVVYRSESEGRLSYLGKLTSEYLPVKDKAQWQLGADPAVTLEFTVLREERDRLSFGFRNGTRYLTGADVTWDMQALIKNFTQRDITVEIYLSLANNGDEFVEAEGAEIEDVNTRKWRDTIVAGDELALNYKALRKIGSNNE